MTYVFWWRRWDLHCPGHLHFARIRANHTNSSSTIPGSDTAGRGDLQRESSMRPPKPLEQQQRRARFESFEERLAMSAQPLNDLVLSSSQEMTIEHHYAEMTPAPTPGLPDFMLENLERATGGIEGAVATFGVADDLTGVTGVRSTYGLSGRGQTVAIIDSGIAYDHQALGGGFGTGKRVVGGWDFAENDANPYDDAPSGFHGTHVAGIVGSSNATYRGVASGVDLVALRVFDDQGNGNFSWVEKALQWVHQHRSDYANPITTVNLSLGTAWNSNAPPNWAMLEDEFAQLKNDGIFIAVSAGNSFSSYNAVGLSYPAASPYVVPVASVDNNGSLSSFSQRNSRVIAAPGRSIVSTVPDFVTGGDGVANDFAGASGTSMAAPYLAGASALVRQTMQLVGYANVTQDTIYNHLRSTADTIFDAVTNANYFRLNVGAAINSLMPTDDYGSTSTTAFALGTLNGSRELQGLIGTLQDQDFFTFTAGQTGMASFRVDARNELSANVALVGGNGTTIDNAFKFSVTAGQQYSLSLGTRAGIGKYGATFAIQQTTVDAGAIEFKQIVDQNITGEKIYQLSASRKGVLTVEAAFAHASGNINLELYDANNKLLGSSRTSGNAERIDVTAASGQAFRLKVIGTNADVDLRLTNLVTVDGSRVIVNGTSGNDAFGFSTGSTHQVTVNGVSYSFATKTIKRIEIAGAGGRDVINATGSSANESVILRPTSVNMKTTTYELQATSVEDVRVTAGAGKDIVYLYDSTGSDRFEARPTSVVLRGVDGSYSNQADGFDFVYAYALAGTDQAFLYDSAGNDRFDAAPTYALMQGTPGTYYNYAQGFDAYSGYASSGTDSAFFYDSKGDDRFVATPTKGTMTDAKGTYANSGEGFDYVYGYSRSGGNDSATLYDSAGNDVFTGLARAGLMRAANNQFNNYVEGFKNLEVRAENGGTDTALINDVAASDKLFGRTKELTVTRGVTKTWLQGFAKISATAANRVTATADVLAVDYVFQKIGKWK